MSEPLRTPSTIVKWAFVLGITLLSNLFVVYLTQALYPNPKYDDFCPIEQSSKFLQTEAACVEAGGLWTYYEPMLPGQTGPNGYCNVTHECQKQFEEAQSVYSRNVFVVFVIFGGLLLGLSTFLTAAPVIALGTSFAGVLALIIGSVWHWSAMQEWLRVIVLGAALMGVIFLAWKKFGQQQTPTN